MARLIVIHHIHGMAQTAQMGTPGAQCSQKLTSAAICLQILIHSSVSIPDSLMQDKVKRKKYNCSGPAVWSSCWFSPI
ncbi:predicted protein [Sclerotinia sclerotiorum 1980 UF-70]|uniref:Uncharacterized protein n=1 Tax=Sclerotinia sclerotiorum (strain ATCC 18683 / 1980 / Ss-1) TaxID=665079 RepID=A7F327_SCLS1|nr:predicted protein [Sclerotinia sclerotiorum 1980 UF-70]EDN96119.1 predicted protein [Sclerotinia sclerotiorum 1980 UF-70]